MCPRFKRGGKNDQIRGAYTTFLQKNIVVCNPKNRWTNAACVMSLVSCLMLHMFLSCLIIAYHTLSCLIIPYQLMTHVSCFLPHVFCLMTHDSCFLSPVSWDMRHDPMAGGVHETWGMKHEPWAQPVRDMRIEPWDITRASWLMDHDSWLMFYISRFTFSHLSWLKPHVVWPTSHVSCFLSHSFFTYHVSYGSSWAHGSCFMCHVPCFHVSCFISNGSCLMFYHDSCLMFYASRFMSQVSCLTSHVSRLI